MKPLLIVGPDSTLRDVYSLATEVHPDRRVEALHLPSEDYYRFDLTGLADFPPEKWNICIAVNEFYINDVRRALHTLVEPLGYHAISLISPHAHVDSSAIVGENTIIHPGCFVGAGSTLGHHCVLRPNGVLGEDVTLGDYVTLEANVSVRELSRIGSFTTLCANTSLARMSDIGAHCYLNIPRQYGGQIPDGTFYSPSFENPVHVISSGKA
ncbi:MAG: hypothetical protein BGO13_11650 [Burkholderiales bacterium 66-5]|nr:MAG: hypothetical protein BGO13_11650 [Burkholderiales bacterium 66-5]